MGCHSFAISNVTVHVFTVTDHAAVKAMLEVPNLNGKHTHWWSKVYGRGIRDIYMDIVYLAGKHDSLVDGLSRHPILLSLSEKLL